MFKPSDIPKGIRIHPTNIRAFAVSNTPIEISGEVRAFQVDSNIGPISFLKALVAKGIQNTIIGLPEILHKKASPIT